MKPENVFPTLTGDGARRLAESNDRVVVAGAGGWLGLATLEALYQLLGPAFHHRVVCYGSNDRLLRLRGGLEVAQSALSSLRSLAPAPSLVLHFAFLTQEKAKVLSEADYVATNRSISNQVLTALDPIGATGVFVASSGAVYMADDQTAEASKRLYGKLKLEDEALSTDWGSRSGTRAVITRVFNVSGPYINKLSSYALASFIADALAGRPIEIKATRPVHRSYVAISELMSVGFGELTATESDPTPFDTAGDRAYEMREIAEIVRAAMGSKAPIEASLVREGSPDTYVGDRPPYAARMAAHRVIALDFDAQVRDTAWFMAELLGAGIVRFSKRDDGRKAVLKARFCSATERAKVLGRALFAVLIIPAAFWGGASIGQTYGAGVSSSGQGGLNCNNQSFGSSNSNGDSSSTGSGSGYSQQQGCGQGYQQGGSRNTGSGASTSFSPTVISQPETQSTASAGQPTEDLRVIAPNDNTFPAPLYARPGATAGQFELYRRPAPQTNEFEKFVKVTIGQALPRFGASLVLNGGRGFSTSPTATVPADYALNPGDELLIGVTGSVEANLRLTIDSQGHIFVPRLGSINVAGIHYGDLQAALLRRFSDQYKQVKISAVIGQLHGITVYVTGFAVSPGAYVVSSLSTMIDAVLQAGGPNAGGSFRTIELRRGGRLVTSLDLYDLLLRGDTTRDAVLQNGDVLNIDAVGAESAVTGSINSEGIYETKAGETLGDLLRFAGGPATLADDSRIFVARLANAEKSGWEEVVATRAVGYPAEAGDIVRLVSRAPIAEPQERQAVLVSIEGEVDHPGRYYLRPGANVGELLSRAGGLTSGAFVFGTRLDRESVQRQQQESFDKAVDDLELAAAAAPLSSLASSSDRASLDTSRQQSAITVIERLRARKPDGRLILNLPYEASALPAQLTLENNDKIYVPVRPTTIGVFGAVYRPGSFLYTGNRLGDYIGLAGGAEKYADRGDVFVVRSNGSVVAARISKDFLRRPALPGDVIFMPVRTSQGAFQRLLDIAMIVFNFGIGAATIKGLVR